MARLDHIDVAWADLDFGVVIMADLQLPRRHCPYMMRLTALGTSDGLNALRPAPARLQRPPRRFHRTEIDNLHFGFYRSPTLIREHNQHTGR